MTGRFFTVALCVLVFASVAQAADWGEIREAANTLNVREDRTPRSEHVVTLAKGQRVKVDFLRDGWYAIFPVNETERSEKRAMGYANAKYLVPVTAGAPAPLHDTQPEESGDTSGEASGEAAAEVSAALTGQDQPVAAKPARSGEAGVQGEGAVKGPVASTPPEPIQVGVDPSQVPVKITSDRMTYDENGKVVSFVGNVVAVHGELTLWANRLSAFFSSRSGKKFAVDSIERIVAEGDVRAQKGKTEGSCGKLTYLVEEQILKMEEDPILKDGPNSLTGNVINFFVRENRSEVVSGQGKRVQAIFLTPEKIKVQ
ncbi:LptA/OstA family protein [Pseudodesulfovibrio aespoeensis]|uniref:LptA/OstA family protein n=1 Tax=Pseudodesulfovibrio aespoeensis TaxID=182210 RepID=UPI002352D352|nr:LptA/OstA family protein [Pseudodesulfovibrio aespoeensis]MCG2731563.1 LptA/OstA family protein [Pseudodesulfovibrio aespoeensis]